MFFGHVDYMDDRDWSLRRKSMICREDFLLLAMSGKSGSVM